MKMLRERLLGFLKGWGLDDAPAPAGTDNRRMDVVLHLGENGDLVVGTLSRRDGEYWFEYSDAFKQRTDLPTIGAFPDRGTVYRSTQLWPFFQVRVPPFDRPDVQEALKSKALDRNDPMALLVGLGARTIASPYDLVRRPANASP